MLLFCCCCIYCHGSVCFILAETYPTTIWQTYQLPLSGNIETSQNCKYYLTCMIMKQTFGNIFNIVTSLKHWLSLMISHIFRWTVVLINLWHIKRMSSKCANNSQTDLTRLIEDQWHRQIKATVQIDYNSLFVFQNIRFYSYRYIDIYE